MPPEAEIQTIKDRFIEQLKPVSIYLFGSFAKGNYREDSDLDFYIVMPDNSGDQIELSQKAYKSLKGLKRRAVDIIVGYESSFNKRANENTIEAIVSKEGKILYERQWRIQEWVNFAEMDLKTAEHLDKTMYPQPLAIICYHCQQAVEKLLKAALIKFGVEIKKTHDLGMLAEELSAYTQVEDYYLDMCYNLTPYGVKVRYPQELFIENHHKDQALKETKELCTWLKNIIEK